MARLHHEGKGLYELQPARTLFWFSLFLVLSINLIVLDRVRRLDPALNVAAQLLTPVQAAITQKTEPLFEFFATVRQISDLRRENARLTQQVQQLEIENTGLKRAAAEAETLRAQLHYARANPQFQLLPATVVGKDLHGLNDFIEIDRGRLDGVQEAMTVVSPDGFLVGRVSGITDHRARILIISNPSSSVAAVIMNGAGQTEDVVDGQVHGRLVMNSIPQDAKVEKGNDVYTSGLGGAVPKGIKIGQIASVKKNDVQLFQQAAVAPYCDFAKLSSIEIITNSLPNG